jgi:diacylglycerol kinase family enzyme
MSDQAMTFPIDLGAALLDGTLHWFVAHCIARHRWWWGRAVAVMNAQWLGDWDLGPRSHPNDGLFDITDGTLPFSQRGAARRRVRTGSHLPHPALATQRASAWTTSFDRPVPVRLDGEVVATVTNLAVRIEPDALRVVV